MSEKDLIEIIKKQNEEIIKLKKDYHNLRTVVEGIDEDIEYISRIVMEKIK